MNNLENHNQVFSVLLPGPGIQQGISLLINGQCGFEHACEILRIFLAN